MTFSRPLPIHIILNQSYIFVPWNGKPNSYLLSTKIELYIVHYCTIITYSIIPQQKASNFSLHKLKLTSIHKFWIKQRQESDPKKENKNKNSPNNYSNHQHSKTPNRLLSTARSMRHVMGMQQKLGLLVHQLNHTPISYLHSKKQGENKKKTKP